MEQDKYSYPLQYDIREVLCNMTSASFEREFAQKNGIFIPNGNKNTIGEVLSLFFWEDDDIVEIQNEAYQKKNISALSGFTLTAEFGIDLINEFSNIISKGDVGVYRIDTPRLISKSTDIKNVFKSKLEYRKRKISKLQFLQEEIVDFELGVYEGLRYTKKLMKRKIRAPYLGTP